MSALSKNHTQGSGDIVPFQETDKFRTGHKLKYPVLGSYVIKERSAYTDSKLERRMKREWSVFKDGERLYTLLINGRIKAHNDNFWKQTMLYSVIFCLISISFLSKCD